MKQSVGMTYTLNIIIIFILIAFAFLMGIMSYSKAYRVNSKIINAIEKCEGYNDCSLAEIDRILTGLGYTTGNAGCGERNGIQPENIDNGFDYCVYLVVEDKNINNSTNYCENGQTGCDYRRYEVQTYMIFDFPLVEKFKIPMRNMTDWIYNFPNDRSS